MWQRSLPAGRQVPLSYFGEMGRWKIRTKRVYHLATIYQYFYLGVLRLFRLDGYFLDPQFPRLIQHINRAAEIGLFIPV